jgi:hypothetical protein
MDLLQAYPAALQEMNADNLTPYQLRVSQLKKPREGAEEQSPDQAEAELRESIDKDEVTKCIRSYCMRNLEQTGILKALYGQGPGT